MGLALRLAALLALTLLGFGGTFYDVARSIGGGSLAAYLLVMPVLLVMIAYGRRTKATGVNDSEADWILGILLAGFALLLSYLAGNRFPTLSGMWNLPLVGAAIWTAFAATILFGFRRVWQAVAIVGVRDRDRDPVSLAVAHRSPRRDHRCRLGGGRHDRRARRPPCRLVPAR